MLFKSGRLPCQDMYVYTDVILLGKMSVIRASHTGIFGDSLGLPVSRDGSGESNARINLPVVSKNGCTKSWLTFAQTEDPATDHI